MTRYPYKNIDVSLNRKARNDLNDNFDDIEADIKELGSGQEQALQAADEAETQAQYASEQGDYANTEGTYASEQGDYAKNQGDYALAQGDHAQTQGDYAQTVGDNAKVNWLSPPLANLTEVETEYPSPEHGDTIMTTEEGKVYRYETDAWVYTQSYTDTPVPGMISDIEDNKEAAAEVETARTDAAGSDYPRLKDRLDAEYLELESEIQGVASGSPAGVYATVTDLENAIPTGDNNIYVVTADGNWYYWDAGAGAWTSGGVYQATEWLDGLTTEGETWEVE